MNNIRLRIYDGKTYVADIPCWENEIPKTGHFISIDEGLEDIRPSVYFVERIVWNFNVSLKTYDEVTLHVEKR